MSQGYLAVDLFFILSGFIIAKSYSSQFQEFSLRKYATFLWLRLARIYPLHLFMLVLYLSVPAAILAFSSQSNINGRFSADYYVLSLALIQNWGFTSDLDWNVPAWSISTEWLAYILFPLLLAVTGFVARVRLLGVLVPLLLLAVTVAFASNGDFGWNIPRYGATRCVLEFWAGICLFQITPAASSRLSRTTAALAFAALCTAYAGLDLSAYPVMPAAFLCLVFALSRDDGVISGALANPALHWLGKISYSTYLVHVFLREWVKFTLVRDGIPPALAFSVYIAAALIGSALLYRWIEVPGRTALRKLIAAPAPRSDAAPPQAANGRTEPTRSA